MSLVDAIKKIGKKTADNGIKKTAEVKAGGSNSGAQKTKSDSNVVKSENSIFASTAERKKQDKTSLTYIASNDYDQKPLQPKEKNIYVPKDDNSEKTQMQQILENQYGITQEDGQAKKNAAMWAVVDNNRDVMMNAINQQYLASQITDDVLGTKDKEGNITGYENVSDDTMNVV